MYAILVAVSLLSICFLGFQAMRNRRTLLEKEQIEKQLALEEEYYKNLESSQAEVENLKEDIEKYLLRMKSLVLDGQLDGLDEMERQFREKYQADAQTEYTKNPIANAVLYDKMRKASAHKILLKCEVALPQMLDYDDVDIVSLFGNVLDNAIEAQQDLPADRRNIMFKAFLSKGNLYVYCKNAKNELDSPMKRRFRTNKKDAHLHGWGRKIIKEIMEKYRGTLNEKDLGDYFETEVLLLLPYQSAPKEDGR